MERCLPLEVPAFLSGMPELPQAPAAVAGLAKFLSVESGSHFPPVSPTDAGLFAYFTLTLD